MEKEDSKVTFYSTRNLLNSDDFRWYNKINNNFYREKMVAFFDNSELIIVEDYNEIKDIINGLMPSEDKRLIEAKQKHEFKMDERRNSQNSSQI